MRHDVGQDQIRPQLKLRIYKDIFVLDVKAKKHHFLPHCVQCQWCEDITDFTNQWLWQSKTIFVANIPGLLTLSMDSCDLGQSGKWPQRWSWPSRTHPLCKQLSIIVYTLVHGYVYYPLNYSYSTMHTSLIVSITFRMIQHRQ